ncbi:MAG: sulfatase-like hydrolase/transferase [Planctomycetota bacterium]
MSGHLYGLEKHFRRFRNAAMDETSGGSGTSGGLTEIGFLPFALCLSGCGLAAGDAFCGLSAASPLDWGAAAYSALHVLFFYTIISLLAIVFVAFLHPLFPRAASGLFWLAAIGALAGFFSLAPALFEGEAFLQRAQAGQIRAGALLGGGLCILAAFWIFAGVWRRRRGAISSTIALLFLAFATGLLYADSRWLTGNYPQAHQLCALFAAFLAWGGTALAFSPRSRWWNLPAGRVALGLLAVAALAFGGLSLVRNSDSAHRWRAGALKAAFPVGRKLVPRLEAAGLGRLLPLPAIDTNSPGVAELLRRAHASTPDRVRKARDLTLEMGPRRYNVVVIAIDTLRADLCGFSSDSKLPSGESDTPQLDQFVKGSQVFPRAYTPYPTSNYAYSSLFSGRWPRLSPARALLHPKEGIPDTETLPERLRREGWRTLAQTGFNDLGIETPALFGHLKRGFDVFNPTHKAETLDAETVTKSSLRLIEDARSPGPFFLFAHYMDAHAPYRLHGADRSKSSKERYRGEVRWVDRHLRPLLDRLSAPDLEPNTIVFIIADHGEAFGEHNTRFHNSSLFEEQVRIPFAVKIPGLAPRRHEAAASLLDILPTTLGILGLHDTEFRNGRDLGPLIFGDAADREAWLDFAYVERFPLDPLPGRELQRALILGDWKVLRHANDPTPEIFQLRIDPFETRNVFDVGDPEQRQALSFLEALDDHVTKTIAVKPSSLGDLDSAEIDHQLENIRKVSHLDRHPALARLAQYFYRGHRRKFDPQVFKSLSDPDRRRIIEVLIGIADNAEEPESARSLAFDLLSDLDGPGADAFMQKSLSHPLEIIRARAASWFARRGDHRSREALLGTLKPKHASWALEIAPVLAANGERRALPWLQAALAHDDADYVIGALRGLRQLAWPELARTIADLLALLPTTWERPLVQRQLIEILAADSSLEATLCLARLGFVTDADIQGRAQALLNRRMTPDRRVQLQSAMEHQFFGEEAWRALDLEAAEREFDAALGKFQALKLATPRLELARARLAWEQGHSADALAKSETLLRSECPPWIKRDARALKRAASSDLERGIKSRPKAKVAHTWLADKNPPRVPNRYFAQVIKVENRGAEILLGGYYPSALRLGIFARRKGDKNYFRRDPGRFPLVAFLPPAGLAPGASITLIIPASTAEAKGSFIADLCLHDRPWPNPRDQILETIN